MKKLVYISLTGLCALLATFGLTAVEAPPEAIDPAEITIAEDSEGNASEPGEALAQTPEEVLVNDHTTANLDPETAEPIDAQVTLCNCKTGPQPYRQCPVGTSCQACPCLSSSSLLNGVCK